MFKVRGLILIIFTIFISEGVTAQESKKRVLEARRTQIKKDIIYINALLSNTKRKEKSLLGEVKDLSHKIKRRNALISTIEEEAKVLQKQIKTSETEIEQQQRDLKELKKDYATIIYNAYKKKSKNKELLFLFSSSNIVQAYKRFQYIKQYTQFRKNQAEKIQTTTREIKQQLDSISKTKKVKETLLVEKKQEQKKVVNEKKKQEQLLSKAKQKESKYIKQLNKFRREEKRINALINKLIREAIARSNKKSGNKKAKGFALTAESKKLASKFVNNRGKLPWPVKKGYISTYYGKQPHPIVKTATIQSHGVRITTSKGSKARSVFDGKVMTVQKLSGNKKAVLIQHGNYITVYKDLENVFVKKGDRVRTKQEIGTIFTDKITGKTILGFLLTKNTRPQNPARWIYRM